MKIVFKATKMKITPSLEEYARKKIDSLKKFVSKIDFEIEIFVEIGRTTSGQKKGRVYRVEAMMIVPGQILRAVTDDFDVRVAIDSVKNELQLEIKKYKGRFDSHTKKEARFFKELNNLSMLSQTNEEKTRKEIIKEEEIK